MLRHSALQSLAHTPPMPLHPESEQHTLSSPKAFVNGTAWPLMLPTYRGLMTLEGERLCL